MGATSSHRRLSTECSSRLYAMGRRLERGKRPYVEGSNQRAAHTIAPLRLHELRDSSFHIGRTGRYWTASTGIKASLARLGPYLAPTWRAGASLAKAHVDCVELERTGLTYAPSFLNQRNCIALCHHGGSRRRFAGNRLSSIVAPISPTTLSVQHRASVWAGTSRGRLRTCKRRHRSKVCRHGSRRTEPRTNAAYR